MGLVMAMMVLLYDFLLAGDCVRWCGTSIPQSLPCFRLHVEHLSNCSFKSRYVGPRVLERFDAVPTDVVEGEVQEHWWFASNGARRFSPPSRIRLVGIETPSFLVGPALP